MYHQIVITTLPFYTLVKYLRYAMLGFLLLMGLNVWAQIGSKILDDSVRVDYGPTTTLWISEKDIFSGKNNNYQPIDTAIRNYHHWTYTQLFNNFYKDLGNIGTAMYPIFPILPSKIGVSSGFESYTPYFATEEPVYFNTRSPYTLMRLVWAGNGRSIGNIGFSRNINPRWNFGFNLRPILVDKQIQKQRKGDRQTTSYYYDTHMSYHTLNGRYHITFNYRRIRHVVIENGGVIDTSKGADYQSLFALNNRSKLTTGSSEELHNSAHIFQQYTLFPGQLDIYYQTDINEEINVFQDTDINVASTGFYDNVDPLGEGANKAEDKTYFFHWTHKIGAKGRMGKFFHDAYFKIRPYRFEYKYFTKDTLALPLESVEYYFGGHASYKYDSLTSIAGWVDLLLEYNYDLGVDIHSKWLDAKITHKVAKPPFIHNAYRGRFDFWNNRFKNNITTQVVLFTKARLARNRIVTSAGLTFTALQNYIYFQKSDFADSEQTVLPLQSEGRQMLLSPEVRIGIRFLRHFSLRSQVVYAHLLSNDDNAIRVPKFFVNTQISYENAWFKNSIQVHIGVDVHWKSAYFDLGYDPAIQQFYVQDDISTPSFFLTDIFFSGKIRNGRFFFRYHNLIQTFTQSGYLSTPEYPGQRNIFDFGFELILFD